MYIDMNIDSDRSSTVKENSVFLYINLYGRFEAFQNTRKWLQSILLIQEIYLEQNFIEKVLLSTKLEHDKVGGLCHLLILHANSSLSMLGLHRKVHWIYMENQQVTQTSKFIVL